MIAVCARGFYDLPPGMKRASNASGRGGITFDRRILDKCVGILAVPTLDMCLDFVGGCYLEIEKRM